ncbi:acyl-CoA dehydratase activase [Candidatus Formimonas warabiya]|uniref:2-hydroxyglutaryl-CoA dehydratase n=1 Tax=Formimonas warabiya TaxID=1761012 RepID=A0A3G1KST2_FORW1|nr:acyl-CoA dehydratase activase [Candidatus Formimonas warabiya]ATW25532.1 2-hydroxyglutaryl-CoA dehydratase [Candidatus Formimonas warabiya]
MVLGIDLGSRNVKIAMDGEQGWEFYRFDTIEFYRTYGHRVGENLRIDFDKLHIPPCAKVVSTGYGRLTIQVEGATAIPEIKAHVLGAAFQTGCENFTLMDLGGQDTKVVKVVQGKMIDFQTNDKCAASSGRFLENMAQVLGISLDELGKHDQDPVELSSTCAVFGESELIGKIIEGVPVSRLAAGVNQAIVNRVKPMLRQLISDPVIFTGGVAFNPAIKEIVQRELKVQVLVPKEPQFNGAMGCCIFGKVS